MSVICNNHVYLIAQRQPIQMTFADVRKKLNIYVQEDPELNEMSVEDKTIFIEESLEEYKENRMLYSSLSESLVKQKTHKFLKADFDPYDYIYEYKNKLEETWNARVLFFHQIFLSKSIFSVSIIPFDPHVRQTIFYKKGYTNHILTSYDKERIINDTESLTVNLPAISGVTAILKGFFKPYPDFDSALAVPEFDPKSFPAINVWNKENIENPFEGINNDAIRQQVIAVVNTFENDIHAQGIGMTILTTPPKVLFFKKA